MKNLLNRNADILIALIPVAIYSMSYCLFEINTESSLKIKTMIVEAISGHQVPPASIIIEYKSRILWLSSSLLSITAYFIAISWSVFTVCSCCRRSHVTKIAVFGLVLITLSLLQIGMADSKSAMYNSIFDTTYLALKASTLITSSLLQKIFFIITTINVLATITPAFILIAICSTVSMPIEENMPKLEFFINRMNYLNQGIMIGSMVLLFGIIHMIAWMQWPLAMLETELKNEAFNTFTVIFLYWGISFTLLLTCFYASVALYWREQVRAALIAMQSDIDISKYLEDNGFTVSWQKNAMQLSAMLTPFLAGSISGGLKLLSLN